MSAQRQDGPPPVSKYAAKTMAKGGPQKYSHRGCEHNRTYFHRYQIRKGLHTETYRVECCSSCNVVVGEPELM